MSLSINIEDPSTVDGRTLISGSEEALRAVYTADECFTFTAEELARPEISFFVARQQGAALGCVALCDYKSYGEVKRLYVPEAGRGKGTARALMDVLERTARDMGHSAVKLETGEKLESAVILYKKLGYTVCGPFGDYPDHPASLFMEKAL
ncbi:MAG: GNAT family N-acetyltransferase [Pseudomonadota bacterium]